jgi:hypothetical protein
MHLNWRMPLGGALRGTLPNPTLAPGAGGSGNPEDASSVLAGHVFVSRGSSGEISTGTTTGGGGGALELVEDITLSGAATSVTFSTGVNGNADEVYFLAYKTIKNVAGTLLTTLRPNGVTTNQNTVYSYFGLVAGAGASGSGNTSTLQIGNNGQPPGSVEVGQVWLAAKAGTRRVGHGQWAQSDTTNTLLSLLSALHWTDTATNITSLDVVGDLANGLGAGSYFRLYRLTV